MVDKHKKEYSGKRWLWPAILYGIVLLLSISTSSFAQKQAGVLHDQGENTIDLTAGERAWIKAHSAITLSITDDIPPRSFIDKDGKIKGTTVDYVRLFEQKLGLKINLVGSDWATALKLALDHEVDGILQAAELEERKPYLNFTQVYSYTPQAVIAGEDEPTISGPDALCGRRVGVLKNSSQSHYLMKHFPCIDVVHFKSLEQVAYALAGGEIHAVFGNYDYYASHFKQAGLVGFKTIYIEYLPPTGFARIGLRNDEPLLLSIFDKAIAAITDEEIAHITNRWLGLKFPSVSADLGTRVNLTPEEQAWLAQDHTVRVRVVNWPPYMMVSGNGQPQGIAIDHLKLIAQRIGVDFKYEVTTQPFADFLESIKKHQGPDLTPVLVQNPEREEYLSFTESYLESPLVIFAQEGTGLAWHITDLPGKTVSVVRGSSVHSQLVEKYPEINLVPLASDELALEALATGQVDACISNLIVASHIIHSRGFGNVHVVAPSTFDSYALSIANRKDWPELTSIIGKAMASISEEEKTAIRKKYIALHLPAQGVSPEQVLRRILAVVAVALVIVITFFAWNWSLRKKVTQRTAALHSEMVEHRRAEQKILDHQQRLKSMTSQLTLVEEQERRRIATDLHDNVGQTLALSRLQLAAASKVVDDVAVKEQLDELSQTLFSAVRDTRSLIFELSSPTMQELGLGAAIREWLDDKIEQQHNLDVELVNKIERDSLDQDQSAFLFRSVRELITNIVKHARAEKVSVLLEQEDKVVRVIVKDNGIGFNPEQVKRSVSSEGGLGLFSIEERMISLGGSMTIDSHVHHGTTIVLTVPCCETTKATST